MLAFKPSSAAASAVSTRTAAVFVGLLAAAALAGCAADSPIIENILIVPGYYDTLTCAELLPQAQSNAVRVKELTRLMEKSSANPAGPVVNAMAYDTDYAKARAAQKYAEEAARRKGCDMTKKVDQKPVDHMPAAPGKSEGFGLPSMGATPH